MSANQVPKLSRNATLLLGLMTGEAEPDGTYAAKRRDIARRLGWSDATLGRALKELRESREIEPVAPGGGAGRPTKYRITRLAREHDELRDPSTPCVGRGPLPDRGAGRGDKGETTHQEGLLEGDQGNEGPHQLSRGDLVVFGETAADVLGGFLRRAYDRWSEQPLGLRLLTAAPVVCFVGWKLTKSLVGKEYAYLGGILGGELALFASLLVPTPMRADGSPSPATGSSPGGTDGEVARPGIEPRATDPAPAPSQAGHVEDWLQQLFGGLAAAS